MKGLGRGRAVVCALCLLGVLLESGVLAAQSSFWQRVCRPDLVISERRWVRAQRTRVLLEETSDPKAAALGAAKTLLAYQLADGKPLEDSHLVFLLARSLIAAGPQYQVLGRTLLLSALERFAAAPEANSAWLELGVVSSQQSALAMAERALSTSLETEWGPERRVRALIERAALRMRMSKLDLAIDDYRVALAEARGEQERALASWGLGVALDRSYDFPAAVPFLRDAALARFGNGVDRGLLEMPGIQFTPRRERYYYRALGQMALAQAQADNRVSTLQAAELMWLTYIREASPADAWSVRASQHLNAVRRLLRQELQEQEPEEEQGDVDLEWMR